MSDTIPDFSSIRCWAPSGLTPTWSINPLPTLGQVSYLQTSTKKSRRQLTARAKASNLYQKGPRAKRVQRCARFCELWHVYSHDSKRRRVEALPGDLATGITCHGKHAKMFDDSPALLVASLRGKEGPWKKGLWSSWKLKRPGVPSSAESTAALLGSTACAMQDVDREVWVKNVGLNVSHHSGWLAYLQQVGFLKKSGNRRKRQRQQSIHVGEQTYDVAQATDTRVLKKVEEMACVGSALQNLTTPRSWSAWREALEEADEARPRKDKSNGYTWPWLVRAHLISSMRSKGISKLSWSRESVTIDDLSGAFPDQKKHVKKMANSMLVKDLLEDLSYDGPLELLTMFLCFFCADGMDRYPADWIKTNRAKLIQMREDYHKRTGLHPHCAVLCKELAMSVPVS